VSNDPLPSATVVIPAYNEEKYIEKTLSSLRNSDYPNNLLEIIVVDNGSSDKTYDIAKKYSDKVLSLKEGNVGAVRNLGAKHTRADILIFLDADCLVDRNWIRRGIKLLGNNENSAFGGPCKVRENANWIERLWLLENPKYPRLQLDLLGGCIFISKTNFTSICGFNENMTSGEDSDLSQRLRKSKIPVNIDRTLSVVHLGNPQTIKDFFRRQVWHSENYLRFIKKSIFDYTFWLVIIFIISVAILASGLITSSPELYLFGFISIIGITLILSLKRLILTKYLPKNIIEATGIIFLDLTYLSARAQGIIKSLIRIFWPVKNKNNL